MKCISRHDHQRKHGWIAYVGWGEDRVTRLFSDKQHGGRWNARRKAIRWRKREMKACGLVDAPRLVMQATPSTNTSGRIGVHFVAARMRPDGIVQPPFYIASLAYRTRAGLRRLRRKRFSVVQHGKRAARVMAIKQREVFEREVFGLVLG